jgi:uncharacterized protein (TIGR00251 family)
MADYLHITDAAIFLDVKVTPGASKNKVLGSKAARLKVQVAAAPEDGKANSELIAFLAKLTGCPKNSIDLKSGAKSRLKTIMFPAEYREKLEGLAAADCGS